jgi:signal transduction histidine kinase
MGAEELRFFVVPETVQDLEEMATNLAFDLRAFLAVIEVEIIVGRLAAEADHLIRNPLDGIAMRFNWSKRFSVRRLVLG